jgi:choline monooxygenase
MTFDRAYEPLHTLPAAWYTDAEALEREQEKVFERSWQYAGFLGNLSEPGQFVTTRLGRVPAVVVRGKDGELRAFVNVCRHRGSEVVREQAGCRQTLQCMYHGWTYNLDGTLRSAPRIREEEGFDLAGFSLLPLNVDTLGPFVFVSADPDAEPLSSVGEAWPDLVREMGLDVSGLVFRERRTYDVAANWKILVENFLECYHCPVSHHGFSDLIDLNSYEQEIHSDLFWHFSSRARNAAVAANRNGIGELPEARRRLWNYVLWPNFMANVYPGPGNISTNLLIPVARDRTLAVYDFYFENGVPEEQQRANVEFIDEVQREDIVLCESVQRGLASGRFDRGRLLKSELFVDRFVFQVARAVTGDPGLASADAPASVRL